MIIARIGEFLFTCYLGNLHSVWLGHLHRHHEIDLTLAGNEPPHTVSLYGLKGGQIAIIKDLIKLYAEKNSSAINSLSGRQYERYKILGTRPRILCFLSKGSPLSSFPPCSWRLSGLGLFSRGSLWRAIVHRQHKGPLPSLQQPFYYFMLLPWEGARSCRCIPQ